MKVKKISIWGRDPIKAEKVKADLSYLDVNIESDIEKLVTESSLIVTTTSSKDPLIQSEWVKPGTHITAVGSDTPEKCELDPNLLSRADLLVADSLEQNLIRGEIHQAAKQSLIDSENVVELGEVFSGIKKGRVNQDSITIADLTGVAVQDLVIAQAVFKAAKEA